MAQISMIVNIDSHRYLRTVGGEERSAMDELKVTTDQACCTDACCSTPAEQSDCCGTGCC
jgi:hypothetical protein